MVRRQKTDYTLINIKWTSHNSYTSAVAAIPLHGECENGFSIKFYIDLDIRKKSQKYFFDEKNNFENCNFLFLKNKFFHKGEIFFLWKIKISFFFIFQMKNISPLWKNIIFQKSKIYNFFTIFGHFWPFFGHFWPFSDV